MFLSRKFASFVIFSLLAVPCSAAWEDAGPASSAYAQVAYLMDGSRHNDRKLQNSGKASFLKNGIITDFSQGRNICRMGHEGLSRDLHPNATLLFLHVFKAAGSTTRDTLKVFSDKCHLRFVTCGSQCSTSHRGYICLRPRGQAETPAQKAAVKAADVVAGHLWFGLHRATRSPALYVTCLRRPLETAVSSTLYLHSRQFAKLSDRDAALLVRRNLMKKIGQPPTNFIKRLTGREPKDSRDSIAMAAAAQIAIANLKSYFVVVGVVEKYGAFVDLLQHLLDPLLQLGRQFWAYQKTKRENSSVKSTTLIVKLLQSLPEVELEQPQPLPLGEHDGKVRHNDSSINRFNASLCHDWDIYIAGYSLFETQAMRLGIDISQNSTS